MELSKMLQLLGTALECSSLALPLASAKPPSPPHSTDTPPHAKATNHGIDVYTLYQDLYQGLSNLESIWLQTVNSNKPLNDDIAAVKELGAICDRLLVAIRPCVPEDASPHESWQRFKLALKSSRKNTELARLKDRLLELQKTLTIDVSKVMNYWLIDTKHQIRQLQLETKRLKCIKSARFKELLSLLRQIEATLTARQQTTAIISFSDIVEFETQIQSISSIRHYIKRDYSVLRTLAFRGGVARHDAIPDAHRQTFEWTFSKQKAPNDSLPSLLTWLETGNGIFWISGKPGAGKSTFMKFIADHPKTQEALESWSAPKSATVISHYFWCAGTSMQKSHQGLLQTLLFEILRQHPDFIETLAQDQWLGNTTSTSWTINELHETLQKLVSHDTFPSKLCFFIDGLDEFDGDHSQLCRQLMSLSGSGNIKLCLSSRPWSVFTEAFSSNTLQLCLHDVTKRDIEQYVRHSLSVAADIEALQTDVNQDLVTDIAQRSQGVFLWVSLITKRLLEEHSHAQSLKELQEALDHYPTDLDDFFTYTLNHVDSANQHKMATSLLISVAADKPLDISIYRFHDLEYENPDYVLSLSSIPPSKLEYRRQNAQTSKSLHSRCCRLLQVEEHSSTVNFLHRTAKDFLDTQSAQNMLRNKCSEGFDSNMCLLKAFTAWAKTSSASRAEEPRAEFIACIKSLTMVAARLHDEDDIVVRQQLLDDLDGSLVDKGPSAEENLQLLRVGVLQKRQHAYLKDVTSRIPRYFSILEVPALVTVLFPDYKIGLARDSKVQWENNTAETISCLFAQGQNPNASFSTAETLASRNQKTPWTLLWEHIMPHEDDSHEGNIRRIQSQLRQSMETGIFGAFLSHGADIDAQCERSGRLHTVVSAEYVLHCFRVRGDVELERMYLEYLDVFLASNYGHWEYTIQDFFCRLDRVLIENNTPVIEGGADFLALVTKQILLICAPQIPYYESVYNFIEKSSGIIIKD